MTIKQTGGIVISWWLSAQVACCQHLPIEALTGHTNVYYQHSITVALAGSQVGFFNTSSLLAPYNQEQKSEMMSQVYMTYEFVKGMKAGAGSFYSTLPGFRASACIQIFKSGKDYHLVVVPRIDLRFNPSYDVMIMTEYQPRIAEGLHFYARFQAMVNLTARNHNRSYQYIRVGLALSNVQTGFAINFDAYGRDVKYMRNFGVFLKKNIIVTGKLK